MAEAGVTSNRLPLHGDGLAARLLAGVLLYVWSAVLPLFPVDRLVDPAYYAVIQARPVAIFGLALWALVDHVRGRRWLAAFVLTPGLSTVHVIATGAVAMVFSFLASGQMPL